MTRAISAAIPSAVSMALLTWTLLAYHQFTSVLAHATIGPAALAGLSIKD